MRMARLGDVATVGPQGPRAGELALDEVLDFVPMAAVSELGMMTVSERRPYGEVSKGFTAFMNDDVLVAKITPCFENNKIARATVRSRYAFGSTEFHVVRCLPERLNSNYRRAFSPARSSATGWREAYDG